VTYAGELAAVIDRRCRAVAPEDVPDVVRGYTVLNDLDALDQPSLTARKAFDDAAPLGSCVTTDVNPTAIDMETIINGEVRQGGQRPANPGVIEPGDEIEITYEGVGTLRNWVE
jgi:2-keto-4-pentenoate hydratase/2-oxohepta-3-ene-1,7-dioic acid hydratase in catechol pathway